MSTIKLSLSKLVSNYESFESIAPGRLCLFGEHQDYLGLPVIALALPLYCRIRVQCLQPATGRCIRVHIPGLNTTNKYDLNDLPERQDSSCVSKPDFMLAALHEALASGWEFPSRMSVECTSTCDFVMKAGCSSSSAFLCAWTQVLARLAGKTTVAPLELAQRAHQAEVIHFAAPGGTMDHVTSALGGMLRIGGDDPWCVEQLSPAHDVGVWVLAYSGQEKDTLGHLSRCKTARLSLLESKLQGSWDHSREQASLTEDEQSLLSATLSNRDTERRAAALLSNSMRCTGNNAGPQLGALMQRHHQALRDGLKLSTPRLEALNDAAMKAGAWGFKVVGSGGGGCGVAWCSKGKKAVEVEVALKTAGATQTWIVREPSDGAKVIPGP